MISAALFVWRVKTIPATADFGRVSAAGIRSARANRVECESNHYEKYSTGDRKRQWD